MRTLVIAVLLCCFQARAFGDESLRKLTTKLLDRHACAVLPHLSTAERNAAYFTMPSVVVGAALREGAGGSTRKEWDTVLGLQEGEDVEVKALADYISQQKELRFGSGSAVFLPPTASVLPSYLRYVQRMHGAEVRSVDFRNPAHVVEMNRWFENQSGIENVLNPGELAENTELVVASACKLDVGWGTKMTRTSDIFHVDGKEVRTDFAEGEYVGLKRSSYAGYEVITVPLAGSAKLWFVLGNTTADVPKIASAFAAQEFSGFGKFTEIKGKSILRVPEIKITSDRSLISIYQALGIKKSFQRGADFSRMTSKPDVEIEKMELKSELVMDHQGIRGGQVVWAAARPRGLFSKPELQGEEIVINRPFVAFIAEENTGAAIVLFSMVRP